VVSPNRVMGIVLVVDKGVPRAAWSGNRRVGTTRRAAVVPNDDDVGRAVPFGQLRKFLTVRSSRDIVHTVADLEFFAERGATRLLIVTERTLEDALNLLDIRP